VILNYYEFEKMYELRLKKMIGGNKTQTTISNQSQNCNNKPGFLLLLNKGKKR